MNTLRVSVAKCSDRACLRALFYSPRAIAFALSSIFFVTVLVASPGCATDELAGLTTRDASATDASALAEREAKAETARQALVAQGNSENLTRQLASSMASTDGKLEQSFTKLMNLPQAADYLNQEVGRLLSIDALSDSYLSDFDRRLDKAVFTTKTEQDVDSTGTLFLENDSYAQLMAAHRLQIEAEKRLAYFLYRALETKWSEDTRPEYKQAAVQLVDHFKYTIQRRREDFASPEMQRLANRFLDAQAMARTIYQEQTSIVPAAETAMDLNGVLIELKSKMDGSLTGEHHRKTAAAKNVMTEIESLKKEIQDTWKASANPTPGEKEPLQKKSITDVKGSITGRDFPVDSFALTFEGGPSENDGSILSLLEKSNGKATFFWKAENLMAQKSNVDRAHFMGMSLAAQTFSGFDLSPTEVSPEKIQHEIVDAVMLAGKAFGERPTLFRCPYGSCASVEEVRSTLEEQKLVHVLWNVDGILWKDANVESVFNRIHKQMQVARRGIITLQDVDSKVAPVTERLLREFAIPSKLRLITVQENIDRQNHPIARTGE